MIRFRGPVYRFQGPGGTLLAALILGVVFTIAGGVLLGIGVKTYRDGQATESWTPAPGRIVSATVTKETRTERDSDGRTRTKTVWSPEISYVYTVGGTDYRGNRVQVGSLDGSSEGRARDVVERYPEGAEVTVYHDPAHPGDAVLKRGADRSGLLLFGGVGGPFTVIGLGALAFTAVFLRRAKRGERVPAAAAF